MFEDDYLEVPTELVAQMASGDFPGYSMADVETCMGERWERAFERFNAGEIRSLSWEAHCSETEHGDWLAYVFHLARQIAAEGQQEPLDVSTRYQDLGEVMNGHHRFLACYLTGVPVVKIKVYGPLNDTLRKFSTESA